MEGYFKVRVQWVNISWPLENIYASDDINLAIGYALARAQTDERIMTAAIVDDNSMVWAQFNMLWSIPRPAHEKTLLIKTWVWNAEQKTFEPHHRETTMPPGDLKVKCSKCHKGINEKEWKHNSGLCSGCLSEALRAVAKNIRKGKNV